MENEMRYKLILTVLSLISLCFILSCNEIYDSTTEVTARKLDTIAMNEQIAIDNFYAGFDESDLLFFSNQSRSFSIMAEAMHPFIKEADGTGSRLYDDCFAGVFLDDFGNLNIGYVQNAITR